MIQDDIYSIKKYLINLDKRKDRLITTTELLSKKGFSNIERFSAVNGQKLSNKDILYYVDKDALQPIYDNERTEHHQLSIGAVGCSLSHLHIWNHFYSSKDEYIMIFEDDTLPNITCQQLSFYLVDVPHDWDIILCGGIYNGNTYVNKHVDRIESFYCLHAYIINKNKMELLLNTALPMSKQIDSWLSDLSKEGSLNIYGLKTNWMQNPEVNQTDIQTKMLLGTVIDNKMNMYIMSVYAILIITNLFLIYILLKKCNF